MTTCGYCGLEFDEAEAAKARRAIMQEGWVPAILAAGNGDGTWGEPAAFYSDKYGGSSWQLLFLAEAGAEGGDPRVRAACESILALSQDRESGGFSASASARGSGGLASTVFPCLTGNMAYSLVSLGLGDDPRVRASLDWICRWQRFDDGDGEAPTGGPYDHNEMCWGRHSCHMGVVKALKALSARASGTARPEVGGKASETIRDGVEYLLAHRVHKKSHAPSEVSRPGWLKFGFPLMYQSDVLEILWILAELGPTFVDPKEERLADALEAVEKARDKDGRWAMRNSFNGSMRVEVEMKGAPSKWLTLRALRALSAFG